MEINFEKVTPESDIQSERCTICKLKQSDYDEVKLLYFNERVRQFLGGIVSQESYKECFEEMIDNNENEIYWTIRLKGTNEFIGLVSIDEHHDGLYKELSYQFLPEFWGNGYAFEVLLRILIYARKNLNLKNIVSETQVKNVLSCKLLNKLGMTIINKVYRFGNEQYLFYLDLD